MKKEKYYILKNAHKCVCCYKQLDIKDNHENNYPDGFQILCYNCNCGRAFNRDNHNICPHKEKEILNAK